MCLDGLRPREGFLATHALLLGLFLLDGSAYGQVALPSAGRIQTIAGTGVAGYTGNGGLALSAELSAPNGVAVDPNNGTIYVSDTGNDVVRAINPKSGDISVYAGGAVIANTPSQITWPNGTKLYCGPLLVGDCGPATSAMLGGPTGLAVDKYSNLYIAPTPATTADTANNRVRVVGH